MVDLKLVYHTDEFKKCKKLVNVNKTNQAKCTRVKLSVNLTGVDVKFFYGLVSLASESIKFENSVINLLASIVYNYLKYQRTNLVIDATIDFNLLNKATEWVRCTKCYTRIQNRLSNIRELNLVGVNLVEKSDIIRTW